MNEPTIMLEPYAEIERLKKELSEAVRYHIYCGELIEAALGEEARKYDEGTPLFEHYASDIRRILRQRDSVWNQQVQDATNPRSGITCPICGNSATQSRQCPKCHWTQVQL